jgi:hypothetical protein
MGMLGQRVWVEGGGGGSGAGGATGGRLAALVGAIRGRNGLASQVLLTAADYDTLQSGR